MVKRHTHITSSILFMLVLGLQGCVSTTTVGNSKYVNQERLTELNRQASIERAVLSFTNGDQVYGDAVRVAWDSTTWLDPDSRDVHNAATEEIVNISFTKKTDGTVGKSTLGGLLAGVLIGGLVGTTAEAGIGPSDSEITAGAAVVGALVGTVVGVFVGTVVSRNPPSKVYQLSGMGSGPHPLNTRVMGMEPSLLEAGSYLQVNRLVLSR